MLVFAPSDGFATEAKPIGPRMRGRASADAARMLWMAIYGNRLLGMLFSPVVALHADGFTHRGRRYAWSEVRRVRVWQGLAVILLRGGGAISIRAGALVKKDAPLREGYSSAFNELVGLLRGNVKRSSRGAHGRREGGADGPDRR
jgi:hypothetical protein